MEELTFAEIDVAKLQESSRALIETYLGRKIQDSDPLWLFTNSLLSIIIQQRVLINDAANQNLLAFARGENLECLGTLVGVKRKPAAAATCHVKLTLSAARNKVTNFASGLRFNAGDSINFALAEDVTFLIGETEKVAKAVCQTEGEIGNGYKIGELNKLVDLQPYLSKIENITESDGGADEEDDESLRNRIRQAPESFSVAGSRGAYEFWAKTFSTEIIDALAVSPEPGYVDLYFLLEGGKVPGDEMIQGLQEYLSADEIRPLTDFLTVKACDVVEYDIEARYYISRNNQTQALQIQAAADKAVANFQSWQSEKLGRDVNPTELYYKLRLAGVKRAEILSPQFTVTPENAVAICRNVNLIYAGLEDD